jgi:hypothetical protein
MDAVFDGMLYCLRFALTAGCGLVVVEAMQEGKQKGIYRCPRIIDRG